MKEDWTKQMQRKLEGHKMAPPAGLWEGISSEMGLSPKPAATKPVRRWYWAAAAVVLALVGFFAFYHHDSSEQYVQVADASSPQLPVQTTMVEPSPDSPIPTVQRAQVDAPLLAQSHPINKVTSVADSYEVAPAEDSVVESVVESVVDSVASQKNNVEPQQTTHLALVTEDLQDRDARKLSESHLSSLTSHPHKWAIGLNASGGLLAANNTVGNTQLYFNMNCVITDTNVENFNHGSGLDSYTPHSYMLADYVWKHHLPMRFGLSLQYQLSQSVALLSGISYTRLSSEFSIPLYPNISYDQHLHYVGLPLGVSWQLWSDRHFRLYVSSSVMVEKCVSSSISIKHEQPLEKPWQWSFSTAAGAEYNVTRQLGIYLEPSIGYYFDDECSLKHYYKEHPLAPAMEFGLRLHLNR